MEKYLANLGDHTNWVVKKKEELSTMQPSGDRVVLQKLHDYHQLFRAQLEAKRGEIESILNKGRGLEERLQSPSKPSGPPSVVLCTMLIGFPRDWNAFFIFITSQVDMIIWCNVRCKYASATLLFPPFIDLKSAPTQSHGMEDLSRSLKLLSDSWQSLFRESDSLQLETESLTNVSAALVILSKVLRVWSSRNVIAGTGRSA